MRIILFGIYFIAIYFNLSGQPGRFIYSNAVADSVRYFTQTLEKSLKTGEIDTSRTYKNAAFWGRIEEIRIRLLLFEEPEIENSKSTVLRIIHFPCYDWSQVLTIEYSPTGHRATLKSEDDNSLKLSYFNLDKLSDSEIKRLSREIEKYGDEAWYLKDIVEKSAISDSVEFRYTTSTCIIDNSLLERKFMVMEYLKFDNLQPAFVEVNEQNYTRTHYCEPIWIVQWWDKGEYKMFLRSNLNFEQESFLGEMFRICQVNEKN